MFEGLDNVGDWVDIKVMINLFFVFDWLFQGLVVVVGLVDGVVDGLFSFDVWLNGDINIIIKFDFEY